VKNVYPENKRHVSFGFTRLDVDGEERPQCLLCMNIFTADCMKQNKLKGRL